MNWLIRLLTYFTKPLNGNPDEWLERPWPRDPNWRDFNCGSCRGLYRVKDKEFEILAVQNTQKNKHFDKVLDWFNRSAQRDKMTISFLEIENPKLRTKLERLGYTGNQTKMSL